MVRSALTRTIGVAGVAVLALTACADNGEDPEGSVGGTADPSLGEEQGPVQTDGPDGDGDAQDDDAGDSASAAPEGLEEFYTQELSWEECYEEHQCAEVTVPMDYENPDGETLEIALAATEVTGNPHLLVNPGGPGESGVDLVVDLLGSTVTSELTDEYDVIGFDPRGVHRSGGIDCMDDEEMDDYRQDDFDYSWAQAQQRWEEITQQCAERTGELIEHMDTQSAAQDLDVIRAALGEDELHYLGLSYGTHLGLAYAERFPEQVGRFVLDGMMDTSLNAQELLMDQSLGFEAAFDGFLAWCVEEASEAACPLPEAVGADDADSLALAIQELFDDVELSPRTMPDDRTMHIGTLVGGFILPMYSQEGWPLLADGLSTAIAEDDFLVFQYWDDLSSGRGLSGEYGWMSDWAFRAVMCLDYPMPTEEDEIEAQFDELVEAAPFLGPYMGHSGLACSQWPGAPTGEPFQPSEDLPPMLFIGTEGDPATPVHWAENMHDAVATSSLLIYEGEGHIAYISGDECVTEIVDAYLIDDELFEGREVCS